VKSKLRQPGNFAQQRAKRWRGIAPPLKFIFASTALRLTADKGLRFTLLKFAYRRTSFISKPLGEVCPGLLKGDFISVPLGRLP